ncbi:unnamed protein product [Periconia digitata]|uniref:Uncharacterized protein n=1 Tax=Periconia digitata TaxID=1303443 RepID=A0A9W4UJX5_9PLEO|nr:unnamed protein product [Periconia digitata]
MKNKGLDTPLANDDSPGIGVGLEIRGFEIVNNDPKAKSPPDKDKALTAVKGAGLVVPDQKTCGTNWALTAERVGDDIETLTFQWVIDGKRTKLKDGGDTQDADSLVLPEIWKEIQKSLEDWAPNENTQVEIKGAEEYGKWTTSKPKVFNTLLLNPGVQITAPLPLSGIQDLISTAKKGGKSALLPTTISKLDRFVLIEKKDLKDWYKPKRIDDDLLGFYSLLLSYVKVASEASAADIGGPKQALPIMPKTSFVTMYKIWADRMEKNKQSKRKRGKENTRLYTIVKALAEKKNIQNFDRATFHWPKDAKSIQYNAVQPGGDCEPPSNRMTLNVAEVNVDWPTKQNDLAAKTLSVNTWINYLDDETRPNDLFATMDKAVYDGQIGALGTRSERNFYLEKELHPLFTFRNLAGESYARCIGLSSSRKNVQINHAASLQTTSNALESKPRTSQANAKTALKAPSLTPTMRHASASHLKKNKGKCGADQVLDAAEGGQNNDTPNPVCKPDDDKKCPAGKNAATRPPKKRNDKNYKAECATDEKSDFECKDKDTYDHRVVKDGKIEHSCRATRDKKKKQKEKATKRSKEAKDPKKKTGDKMDKDKKEREKNTRDKNRRTRSGFCFALLGGTGAWGDKELEDLSADEIDGLVDTWPDDMQDSPGFIPDWVVKIEPHQKTHFEAVGGDMMMAGAFPPLLSVVSSIVKMSTGFARVGGLTATRVYRTIRTGARGPAKAVAKQAAKSSNTVGKILKDKRFLDCLSVVASTAGSLSSRDENSKNTVIADVGDNDVSIDWSRKDPGIKIQPEDDKQIVVKLMTEAKNFFTNNQDPQPWAVTYPDAIIRPGRLYYEQCTNLPDDYKNQVSAIAVEGGCCIAYADSDCKPESWMFGMENREVLKLKGHHNDNIESFWCTFWSGLDGDELCQGAPRTGNGVAV